MTKTMMLTGASALVAAALTLGSGAQAAAGVTQIYGGGSSLIALTLRQTGDCYGNQVPLVIQGSVLSGAGANEATETLPYFNYLATPAFNCAPAPTGNGPVNANETVNYESSGSGQGIAGLYSHDATTYWGDTVPGTDPSPYPAVSFANSDYGLAKSDVTIYNGGGTEGSGSTAVTVAAPGGTPDPYPNPLDAYGAQIQIPLVVVPVALAYSAVYKETADSNGVVTQYSFNLKKKNADGSGGLLLDVPTMCAIYNGQITLWSDPALTALNGGQSLKSKSDKGTEFATLPIEMVGRADKSGTTSIFYRALAAQCGQGTNGSTYTEGGHDITYTNQYLPAGSKTVPGSLAGNSYATGNPNNGPSGSYTQLGQVGKFTLATLSSGVAEYLAFTVAPGPSQTLLQGRLGYLSPDYALPAVLNTGANTYDLNIVDALVAAKSIEPTSANAVTAFGAILPPQSTSTGAYSATATSVGLRSAPEDWAEPISTTLTYSNQTTAVATPLADPTAGGTVAHYPLIGTSNVNLYTCYAASATSTAVINFYTYWMNSTTVHTVKTGLLSEDGLAPMPKAWQAAIVDTFFAPTAKLGTLALDLGISHVGAGAATQCATVTPGA